MCMYKKKHTQRENEMQQKKNEIYWNGMKTNERNGAKRGRGGKRGMAKKHGVNSKCYRSGLYVVRFTNMRKI